MQQEDRMDSFVLAETFKYLYLLFSEDQDLMIDIDSFVFTTEGHLLPLSLARLSPSTAVPVSAIFFFLIFTLFFFDKSPSGIFFSFLRQNYRRIFAVERIARSASRRRCRICSQLSKHKLPFSRKCQLRPRHPIAFGQFGFKQMPNSQKL